MEAKKVLGVVAGVAAVAGVVYLFKKAQPLMIEDKVVALVKKDNVDLLVRELAFTSNGVTLSDEQADNLTDGIIDWANTMKKKTLTPDEFISAANYVSDQTNLGMTFIM